MRTWALSIVLTACLLASGCEVFRRGVHKTYEGPTRAASQIAIVRAHDVGGAWVRVHALDGKSVGAEADFELHILPGQHQLSCGFVLTMFDKRLESDSPVPISFVAEPGHEYLLGTAREASQEKVLRPGRQAFTHVDGTWWPVLVDASTKMQIHPTLGAQGRSHEARALLAVDQHRRLRAAEASEIAPGDSQERAVTALASDATGLFAVVGGAIYKRKAGFTEWSLLETGIRGSVSELMSDAAQSVLVARGNAIHTSADHGETWQLRSPDVHYTVAVHPSDPKLMFASGSHGFSTTGDGGLTWQAHDAPGHVVALSVEPVTSALYAGAYNAERTSVGVHKSSDGGKTWQAVFTLPPPLVAKPAIGILPVSPSVVFVGFAAARGGLGFPLMRSADGGASWSDVDASRRTRTITSIAVSASTPHTVYVGTTSGLYRGGADGSRWEETNLFLPVRSLLVDAARPGVVLVGTDDLVVTTADSGVTWVTIGAVKRARKPRAR